MLTVITTIITAISSIIVAYIANNKREERSLALLHKLSDLTKDETHNKLEISRLFEMITRLKISSSDVKKIIEDENAIWIVYMLKKTPGYVTYENGVLKYSERFKNKKIRLGFDIIDSLYLYSSFILMCSSLIIFSFTDVVEQKAFFGILLFIFAFSWIYMLRNRSYFKKVKELIENA